MPPVKKMAFLVLDFSKNFYTISQPNNNVTVFLIHLRYHDLLGQCPCCTRFKLQRGHPREVDEVK